MIKKFAVTAAAAVGLVLATAGGAVAGSDGYGHGEGGGRGGVSGLACAVGNDAGVSNICGNTNVYKPIILGSLLNLLSPPHGGGGGGNNGGGNNGGGNN
ncbi:hypothetical protein OHA98_19390 [Streptomyces sp. NBC_00654]|uniref:hypothetical protein n=1 Tax=Streptomyces sp. NBC_00654 TaxID=2975799 RepID=UPI00225BF98B|nr:hypothetical protein [Streptomyces sp. NBC_00654]MCX4966951.1 hypothetical protein [Streptomyces sp. NBC_00654]